LGGFVAGGFSPRKTVLTEFVKFLIIPPRKFQNPKGSFPKDPVNHPKERAVCCFNTREKFMKRYCNVSSYLAVLFFLLVFSTSCIDAAPHKMIQIKGSDTMVNLAQAWAEEFMNANKKVMIAVTGGGSGTGISAMISGLVILPSLRVT